tara:strand:+ start:94308 stop:95153 length:846 start_codon:yes stop_codon:yes gene_type:complete
MNSSPYEQIAVAIDKICADPTLSLGQLAALSGQSESHFQRQFSRWVGVSPKRFAQLVQRRRLQAVLRESHDMLTLSLEAGLSGPGRLHDLVVTCDAVTPAQLRNAGEGVELVYGFGHTPFGQALIGMTSRGICYLVFSQGMAEAEVQTLKQAWPLAHCVESSLAAQKMLDRAFALGVSATQSPVPLHLYLRGSNFQLKVWQALLNIPAGQLATYADIAVLVDSPRAARAVGTAVGANHIGFLIPCHRVIRATGVIGDYRWGSTRKTALIGWEAALGGQSAG